MAASAWSATIPLAPDNPVQASSTYRTSNLGNLLDESLTTNWMSEGYTTGEGGTDRTPWLIYNFDDVYTVDSITLYNFYGGESVRGVRAVDVYVSLDGTFDASAMTSTPLFSFELQMNGTAWVDPPVLPYPQTFEFPDGTQALSVMLVFRSNWFGYTFEPDAPPTEWANISTTGLSRVNFTAVPEPATMTLLALGGLALLRRGRR